MDMNGEENGPPRGTGEAHSHLSAGRPPTPAEELRARARQTADGASDRFEAFRRNTAERIEDVAHRSRQRAGEVLGRAEQKLEEKTNLVSTVQEYPLAAIGIAFGAGFLLAGSRDRDGGSHRMSHAIDQLKGALVGSLSAAVSRELRAFVDDQGGPGALAEKLRSSFEDLRDRSRFPEG